MKSKATHSGHCQVCGRLQKLPNDLLSLHGYTVEWGFFNGTCWGADHLPFEKSIDLIERAIAGATESRDKLAAESAAYKAGELAEGNGAWNHSYRPGEYRKRGGYFWEVLEISPASDKERGRFVTVKDGKRSPIDCLPYNIETVDECRIYLNSRYAQYALDKRVEELDRYIKWQEARIKDWKPTDLLPVKDESEIPTTGKPSLRRTMYGEWSGYRDRKKVINFGGGPDAKRKAGEWLESAKASES